MSNTTTSLIVGVDVGGTYTDLVLLDQATGAVRLSKVASTLTNQAHGVMAALQEAAADLATVDLIVHGTTTTTNAVLERKLSKTGLITTGGFRDVLELGRRTRPQAYGMKGKFTPIIPRNLRLEVPERMDATGQVVVALDESAVHKAAAELLAEGCESVVVHFLHAYANPAHELQAAAILTEVWPNAHITMGHALLSESREYERGVTAAVNASVQPLLERYIARLQRELAGKGYKGELLVMNGNGGMVSADRVSIEAAKTVMSGPASGVMAAAYTGPLAGFPDLMTYDMGGTSTDVSLIRNATPAVSNEIEIEYAMPIHVPMVDVRTVGAGGGSIAQVSAAGLLEVGPQSAGADPGPVCYGKGGLEPTISDANLLLGRLDPGKLKSISGGISAENVAQVFKAKLGDPLGLSAVEAADAVIRVANTKMAGAIRTVSVSLGHDPRDFALFAFGGAGPLHATSLARELGVPKVLVPARPGITNALGCVVADLRHDFVQTLNTPLDKLENGALQAVFRQQRKQGELLISKENIKLRSVRPLYSVDMQFVGQTHLIRVPVESAEIRTEALRQQFEAVYFARFKVELAEIRANLVNVNCSVIGEREPLDLSTLLAPESRKNTLDEAMTGRRGVHFDGNWFDAPIYWRDFLPSIVKISGPAVIEQLDTTILLEPGDAATCDAQGNLIIDVGKAP